MKEFPAVVCPRCGSRYAFQIGIWSHVLGKFVDPLVKTGVCFNCMIVWMLDDAFPRFAELSQSDERGTSK